MPSSALVQSSLFDTVSGLPLHPLVVHFAVVLLPLSAAMLIALVLIPAWRQRFGWLTMAGLTVGAGAAFVAKESGEALAKRVGMPREHAEWGDRLPLVAVLLLVLAAVWFLGQRRTQSSTAAASADAAPRRSGAGILGMLASIVALAVIALSVIVGHSGATAVWAGEIEASSESTTSTPSTTSTTSPTSMPTNSSSTTSAAAATTPAVTTTTTQAPGTYTMAQVAQHATTSSCWTVVNDKVYDVTAWVSQHPGGPDPIGSLCGHDGTSAFTNEHGTERKPNSTLDGYKIGTLAK